MKIRWNALLVSSVLFTIALLLPLPAMLENAATWRQDAFPVEQGADYNYYAPIGLASLTIIVIGLIVTWAGYIRGLRWTWFVLLTITLGWGFAVVCRPYYLVKWRDFPPLAEWLPIALREPGPHRVFGKVLLTLLLMIISVLLPIRSFLRRQTPGRPTSAP